MHCFCQKPLTHTIYEARLMAEVAREKKVATQMGNQGTAVSALRKAAAVIQSGVLGKVNRSPRLDQPADLAAGRRPRQVRSRARNNWTGTSGSARRPSVPTPPAIIRSPGAAGGTSAPAPWATWPATR